MVWYPLNMIDMIMITGMNSFYHSIVITKPNDLIPLLFKWHHHQLKAMPYGSMGKVKASVEFIPAGETQMTWEWVTQVNDAQSALPINTRTPGGPKFSPTVYSHIGHKNTQRYSTQHNDPVEYGSEAIGKIHTNCDGIIAISITIHHTIRGTHTSNQLCNHWISIWH